MKSEEKKKAGKSSTVQADDRTKLVKEIWGKRKITRVNKVIDPEYCGKLTMRELCVIVLLDKLNFPDGLDTPLCVGDFEGNFCTNVLGVTKGGEQSDHLCLMGDPNGCME